MGRVARTRQEGRLHIQVVLAWNRKLVCCSLESWLEKRCQGHLGDHTYSATVHLQDRSLAGKLEPVSPPSPPHADPELDLAPSRLSKEELIQNMDRVDREITMVEQQISKLKKKQVSSEDRRGDSSGGRDQGHIPRCPQPCGLLVLGSCLEAPGLGTLG